MNKIFLYYQPKLNQLIKALNLIGVELTLVGGAVRDFIGFNKFSSDLDIELTTDINIKSFDLFIDDIIQALRQYLARPKLLDIFYISSLSVAPKISDMVSRMRFMYLCEVYSLQLYKLDI